MKMAWIKTIVIELQKIKQNNTKKHFLVRVIIDFHFIKEKFDNK